jgi:hypothetical protein
MNETIDQTIRRWLRKWLGIENNEAIVCDLQNEMTTFKRELREELTDSILAKPKPEADAAEQEQLPTFRPFTARRAAAQSARNPEAFFQKGAKPKS